MVIRNMEELKMEKRKIIGIGLATMLLSLMASPLFVVADQIKAEDDVTMDKISNEPNMTPESSLDDYYVRVYINGHVKIYFSEASAIAKLWPGLRAPTGYLTYSGLTIGAGMTIEVTETLQPDFEWTSHDWNDKLVFQIIWLTNPVIQSDDPIDPDEYFYLEGDFGILGFVIEDF